MTRRAAAVSIVVALGGVSLLLAQPRPAYVVTEVVIHDRIAYQEYELGLLPTLEPFGGELIAVSDEPTVLDGDWSGGRVVLFRFPSRQSAVDWHTSPAYQELAVLRRAMSTGTDLLVDGRRGGASP